METFAEQDVVRLLGVSRRRLREFVRAGVVDPDTSIGHSEQRYAFRDLVVLKSALHLTDAHVSSRRLKRTFERLREQMGDEMSLAGLKLRADGRRIVAEDSEGKWEPESGQRLLAFGEAAPDCEIKTLGSFQPPPTREDLSVAEWFALGCELEASAPLESRDAYRRVLERDPSHAEAHINLGRLLHESGDFLAAQRHYLRALDSCPQSSVASFNLGVVLEDVQDLEGAKDAYRSAVSKDAGFRDAYYNLAGVLERLDKPAEALRTLRDYRTLANKERSDS